jgi:hypothetical protein
MAKLVVRTRLGPKADSLARLVIQRAPNLKCSSCGRQDFGLIEDPDNESRYRIVRHYPGVDVSQDVVTLLCTHCGHLEQFADAVLQGVDPNMYGDPVTNG